MAHPAETPQPPPKPLGEPVTDALIEWIHLQSDLSKDEKEKVIEIIEGRRRFGLEKYGQLLMTHDGRSTAADAIQEAGDLLQYAYKAKMNGELHEVRVQVKSIIMLLLKLLLG